MRATEQRRSSRRQVGRVVGQQPKPQLPQCSPRTLSQECGSFASALLQEGWPRVATPFREQSYTVTLKPLPD